MNVANLYVIADLDNMQVVGAVDEADIGQVKVGQHVTFTVDSYPNDTFTGTVTQVRINPTTTNNVVTYEVIVGAPNPDHKLIPGMTANLTIYTLELDNITAVPLKALKFQPMEETEETKGLPTPVKSKTEGEHFVWVKRDSKLIQTPVELGVSNNVYQQITKGLKDGDQVAIQYMQNAGKAQQKKGEENPFMPKPPGANRKNK